MPTLATPIAESLKFTDFIVPLVLHDLPDDVARRRARGDDGPSIAWIIGHLCHYRLEMMKLLGHDPPNPYADLFGTSGASDGSGYPSIEELKRGWTETSTQIHRALESASDSDLLRSLGGPDTPHGEKKVLDTMVFYMWHESYHMGQLGMLRVQFGLTPTATLAVEAASASA